MQHYKRKKKTQKERNNNGRRNTCYNFGPPLTTRNVNGGC